MKRITTLTGPSCSGKSTLEAMMAERGCLKAISTTTRSPRAGEVNGKDYYFVSQDEFAAMRDAGAFVEYVQFGEHWYGMSTDELLRLFAIGDHVVIVCEPIGAKQIYQYFKHNASFKLVQVFIDNAKSVINQRFLKRFGDDLVKALVKGDFSHQKVIEDGAKRMAIMTTTEQKWISDAYMPEGDFRYSLVVSSFTEDNCDSVANALTKTKMGFRNTVGLLL